MEYTDGLPTPELFRRWGAITCLAGLLERRVWVTTARQPVFPNLYTLLVAPPGVGKSQIINQVNLVWRDMKDLQLASGRRLHVAPDNMTKASLIDALAKAATRLVLSSDKLHEYHSMCIGASEFSLFLPQHDMEFLSALIHFYDSPEHPYEELRRGTKDHPTIIPHPQLNILGGITPGFLGHLMPEQAWVMGFTSRLILVFSGEAAEPELFPTYPSQQEGKKLELLWTDLLHDAKIIANLYGELKWTDDAKTALTIWYKNKMQPVPLHPKLTTYNIRRLLHALKLITVVSVSESTDMKITEEHVQTGIAYLLHAEQFMPEIFKDMASNAGGGTSSAMNELHFFALREFAKNQKALHAGRLINFLAARVPSYQVLQIIDLAVKSNLFRQVGDMYHPLSRNQDA